MLYLHTSLYVQCTSVIFYVSLSLLHWRECSGTFLIAVQCMRLRIGLQCQKELELPFIHHATQASIQQHMLGAQKCFLHECVCVCQVASVVSDSVQPCGWQPPRLLCPWGLSRQEYWNRLPSPPPGDLPDPEIKPTSRVSYIGRRVLYH